MRIDDVNHVVLYCASTISRSFFFSYSIDSGRRDTQRRIVKIWLRLIAHLNE